MILSALRRLPAAALCALATVLAACGGSPGPSPNVVDTTAITVLPASATIYPGGVTTLRITGGTGSYLVASDNQAVVPIVTTTAVGRQLTVVANPVSADTTVTLTVRDTSTTPRATVTLTVRPGTIANAVTIVPASNACEPAICSGGEALVTATISQAGIPLPGRLVRFDVVSGDVRFIVSPPGTTGEVLALSTTTTSDQAGLARVRLRVLANVPNQTALIQITDPETGSLLRIAVNVRQFTGTGNPVFFAIPESVTFRGQFIGQCAGNSVATDFVIFGGTPPYNVVNANGAIFVSPNVVQASGQAFTARLVGSPGCFTDLPITITDAAGRTIVVRVSNVEGTNPAPAAAVGLSPTSVTIGCGQSASFVITGGTTPFSASSNNGLVTAAVAERTVTVERQPGGTGMGNMTTTITVTDGTAPATGSVISPATCP